MNSEARLRLLQALDPLFPIGAYTLSGGLETYTQLSLVRNKDTLREYIEAYLYFLPGGDLGFAALSAKGADYVALDEICAARLSPYELRKGSERLCANFLKAQKALRAVPELSEYQDKITGKLCGGYFPIAAGLFIKSLGLTVREALEQYCYGIISSAVNHAVKLVPLRQTDGQEVLSGAFGRIGAAVSRAMAADISELGASGCGFDLRAMQHESLPGRLYTS
jgi:urease accessory protein